MFFTIRSRVCCRALPNSTGARSHILRLVAGNCKNLLASKMSTTSSSGSPSVPRPSASLIVVNHRNEILLVHRNPKASSFGGVHVRPVCRDSCGTLAQLTTYQVFPGGNYDQKQDSSLEMTAIRETFEESGLLIAVNSPTLVADDVLDSERKSIHAQDKNFQTFLSEQHLTADTSSLLPFTTWVTPVSVPRYVNLHMCCLIK